MPDIFLDRLSNEAVRIEVKSVHGMLWLQQHFDDDAWESLSYGLVGINTEVAQEVAQVAELCGLHVLFP